MVMEWLILKATSKHVEDKKVVVSSQHRFTRRKSCLKQPDYLLQWDNWLTRWGKPWVLSNCNSARLLALSLMISLEAHSGCVDWMSGQRWIVNWLNGRSRDEGIECLPRQLTNDTRLGEVADTTECCVALQKDLDRLKRWAEKNHYPS